MQDGTEYGRGVLPGDFYKVDVLFSGNAGYQESPFVDHRIAFPVAYANASLSRIEEVLTRIEAKLDLLSAQHKEQTCQR